MSCSCNRVDWSMSLDWKMHMVHSMVVVRIEIVGCSTNDSPYWIYTLGKLLDSLVFPSLHHRYCSMVSNPNPITLMLYLSLAQKRIPYHPCYQTVVAEISYNLLCFLKLERKLWLKLVFFLSGISKITNMSQIRFVRLSNRTNIASLTIPHHFHFPTSVCVLPHPDPWLFHLNQQLWNMIPVILRSSNAVHINDPLAAIYKSINNTHTILLEK